MGRNKARLKIGGRTMLSVIHETASRLEFPVRVILRDIVSRCGPLGGVFTRLKTTRSKAVLFLACDMPFISAALLRKIIRTSQNGTAAVFVLQRDGVGFPFLLPVSAVGTVESQMARGAFSIRELADALRAAVVPVPAKSRQVFNVNTAEDAAAAERLLARRGRKQDASLVTRRVHPYGSRHAKSADCSVARKRSRR